MDRVLTNVEPQILRRYYEARGGSASSESSEGSGKHGRKGKNKGKRKGLPPGLAKRGGSLPPGLAKRLPSDLEHRLRPRPRSYWSVIFDNDIALIDAATNKVLDILEDVLTGGG